MATQVSSGKKHLAPARRAFSKLKAAGVVLTLFGLGLFIFFIYSTGFGQIKHGIARVGISGFALILFIYLLRISVRATAWKLSVYEPYSLRIRDTFPAVIIGEALSSMIPLGILMSGTAKAVAVRKKVPLVVGLSSVATENLFYSLVTGLFLVSGAVLFLRSVPTEEAWAGPIDFLVVFVVASIIFGILAVIRQWHFASWICDRIYDRGYFRKYLESGRIQVRLFENLIYGFYRKYPGRFLPIVLLQVAFHALGVVEVLFILSKIRPGLTDINAAFFLESVSRLVTIIFKLIPFVIGVDEAGANFIAQALALGTGVGVTIAIVRKARIVFWALVGILLIAKRGLKLSDIHLISRRVRERTGGTEL